MTMTDHAHIGDPCTKCATPHDDVAPGRCLGFALTTTYRELASLRDGLKAHEDAATKETARLKAEITSRQAVINQSEAGIDAAKIALAKAVIFVRGEYSKAGDERGGARSDAIRQLATGQPVRQTYGDLWRVAFGTKNYDRWSGQRCDCEYGMGPSHGYICFQIGLHGDVRKRDLKALTEAETEAAIYYLTHLEVVQAAEKMAASA